MRIVNTEVYKFDELSEEVQEKVIKRHRYMEVKYSDNIFSLRCRNFNVYCACVGDVNYV